MMSMIDVHLAHREVQQLMGRIQRVFVPGVKLTLVARSSADPTGEEDHVFTNDRLEDAIGALQQAAARRDRDAATAPASTTPHHNED